MSGSLFLNDKFNHLTSYQSGGKFPQLHKKHLILMLKEKTIYWLKSLIKIKTLHHKLALV